MLLNSLDIVRTDEIRVLFRTIETAICVQKTISCDELRTWIREKCEQSLIERRPIGLNLKYDASAEAFGRELASLADQDLTEPILDKFIQTHGAYFVQQLKYRAHLSQPKLKWVNPGPNDPSESIPDYLLQRGDGYWNVLDLKRAALKNRSIVRGIPSRPRFIDYVDELIAQLVRYEAYFSNPENAAWAEENLGVRTKDLKLIGLVGNYDTFVQEHVELAMQQYKENIAVMSYTDVVALLRKSGPH
jgi:hypothetical protein